MELRRMVDNYLINKYKDGVVTLYINTKKREYTIGSLDTDSNINDELIETMHLALGLGNDFVAAILPNPLTESLKLIDDIEKMGNKIEEGEAIDLTIPTSNTIEESGGSVLVLIFGTSFTGTMLLAYDHLKMIQGSVLLETENGIQITH